MFPYVHRNVTNTDVRISTSSKYAMSSYGFQNIHWCDKYFLHMSIELLRIQVRVAEGTHTGKDQKEYQRAGKQFHDQANCVWDGGTYVQSHAIPNSSSDNGSICEEICPHLHAPQVYATLRWGYDETTKCKKRRRLKQG